MRFSLILFVSIFPGLLAVILINEKVLTFDAVTKENLPFPLPDPADLSLSIVHGTHCLEVLETETKGSGPVYQMHKAHCIRMLKMTKEFILLNTNYRLPTLICNDLANYRPERAKIQVLKFYCPSCLNQPIPSYDEKREENQLLKQITTANGSIDSEKFWLLAGFNYGKLLMKNHFHQDDLTEAERNYLSRWDSKFNINMSALGLLCQSGNPMERLEKVLNQKESP